MSREGINLVIDFLSVLTILSQILSIVLIVALVGYIFSGPKSFFSRIIFPVATNAVPFSFLVAGIATAGSLFLSEIAKFYPCMLCWYQRIFMYPNVIIGGIASVLNDQSATKYLLTLSSIGFGIASYHYFIQMFPDLGACSDVMASCTAREFATFGYITIPLMSASAFLNIILFSITRIVAGRRK